MEADFKEFNALLASPYGWAHQLSAVIEDGTLVIKALSGMEVAARAAELRDEDGTGMMATPGMADARKKTNEMRAEFRRTLPNAVDKTNGRREGKTVIWLVERATCKDAEDFARQLGDVWEARCPSKNIKITPSNPARLGLALFNALATGANGSTGSSLDTNQM